MKTKSYKSLCLIFLPLIIVLLTAGCSDTTLPPQSALDYFIKTNSLDSLDKQKLKLNDYLYIRLSDEDIANGVVERWCLAYKYSIQDESGNWRDTGFSWLASKKGDTWMLDDVKEIQDKYPSTMNHDFGVWSCDFFR